MISPLDNSTFLVLYSHILEHDANDTIKNDSQFIILQKY